jgi:cytoskeletal protein CcmA (bactofilin family)
MFGSSSNGPRPKDFERPQRPNVGSKDSGNLLDRDDNLDDRFGNLPSDMSNTSAPTPYVSSYLGQGARNGPTPAEGCASVVAEGSQWKGTMSVDSSVRIDGQVNGEINAKDTVHISEGARVDAKIQAAYVVVAGTFQGQMRCKERLELMPKSKVRGEIATKLLTVHEGAFIDGHLQMTEEGAPAAATPRAASAGRSGGKSSSEPVVSLIGSDNDD